MRLSSVLRRFAIGLRRLPSSSFPKSFLLPLVILAWLGAPEIPEFVWT